MTVRASLWTAAFWLAVAKFAMRWTRAMGLRTFRGRAGFATILATRTTAGFAVAEFAVNLRAFWA